VENGGSSPGTRQFIWSGDYRREVRDASGNLTAQFFPRGETISGTSYYFTKDHLGSIREMTNGAGTIVWQQSFDPFGVPTTLVSTTAADIGYAGYYVHSRSGLNLTRTRAYSASLGRFISRDPIEEKGGTNLYAYVMNNPMSWTDPDGLDSCHRRCNSGQECIPIQWHYLGHHFDACVCPEDPLVNRGQPGYDPYAEAEYLRVLEGRDPNAEDRLGKLIKFLEEEAAALQKQMEDAENTLKRALEEKLNEIWRKITGLMGGGGR
jgi:RHS repeat-associated protein